MAREAAACRPRRDSSLVLLTSSGLPNDELRQAFRELVMQLPESAWRDGSGAARKAQAHGRRHEDLASRGFREPELYEGLEIVVLEDPCFLKRSFWDKSNTNFDREGGLNHAKANHTTPLEMVRPFFHRGLDDGWCVDWMAGSQGGFELLGFQPRQLRRYGLLDAFASSALKLQLLRLQTAPWPPAPALREASERLLRRPDARPQGPGLGAFRRRLEEASILVVNGGNPDLASFVLRHFAGNLLKPALERIRAGSLVYLARSAGAMAGSADEGLTFEPKPSLLDVLLHNDTSGLGLTGRCAIRPHYEPKWDLASRGYAAVAGVEVVRLRDGDGLQCLRGECSVVGNGWEGQLELGAAHGQRLAAAFAARASRGDSTLGGGGGPGPLTTLALAALAFACGALAARRCMPQGARYRRCREESEAAPPPAARYGAGEEAGGHSPGALTAGV